MPEIKIFVKIQRGAKRMGFTFSHHGVHGDFKKVFSVFSVRSVVEGLASSQ